MPNNEHPDWPENTVPLKDDDRWKKYLDQIGDVHSHIGFDHNHVGGGVPHEHLHHLEDGYTETKREISANHMRHMKAHHSGNELTLTLTESEVLRILSAILGGQRFPDLDPRDPTHTLYEKIDRQWESQHPFSVL